MPARSGSGSDSGIATVWTAIAIAAVLVLTALLYWLGSAAVTRHRASNAADLAALSAAAYADRGRASACAKARWVTRRMGAQLRECRLDGWDALVRVELVPSGFLGQFGAAHAKARAGPVTAPAQRAGGAHGTTSGTSGG